MLVAAIADPVVDPAVTGKVVPFDSFGRSVPRMIIGGRAYPTVTNEEGFFALLDGVAVGGEPKPRVIMVRR